MKTYHIISRVAVRQIKMAVLFLIMCSYIPGFGQQIDVTGIAQGAASTTIGNCTVSISRSGGGSFQWQGSSVATYGLASTEGWGAQNCADQTGLRLEMAACPAGSWNNSITVTFTFTTPVTANFSFNIYDITEAYYNDGSLWAYYQDRVYISATDGTGSSISPSNITATTSGSSAPDNATTATERMLTANLLGAQCLNQLITISAPCDVKTITIRYTNVDPPTHVSGKYGVSQYQYIFISNLTAVPKSSVSGITPACGSSSTTLTATTTLSSPTYSWSGTVGTTITSPSASSTAVSGEGTYTVTITGGGCSSTASITIDVSSPFTIGITDPSAICSGSSVNLPVSITSGSPDPPTYLWNSGQTTSSINVSPAATTTYTVTATSLNCSATDNVTVTVNTKPTVTASSGPICAGLTATLTAGGASTYSWSGGASSGSSVSVTPIVTTTYTVTGTDINGCTGSNQTTVNVTTPNAGALTQVTETICDPSAITFSVPPNNSGATSYTFTWYSAGSYISPCPTSVSGLTQVAQKTVAVSSTILFQNNFDTYTAGNIGAGLNGWNERIITASTPIWAFGTVDGDICLNMRNGAAGAFATYNTLDNSNKIAYYATTIDATAYTSVNLSFDWKCNGEIGDYGKVVYSTDGGTNWSDVTATTYWGQSAWQSVTNLDVSSAIAGKTFLLGFRWTCDADMTRNNPSFCVDNVILTGIAPAVDTYDPGPVSSDETYVCLVTITGGTCNGVSALATNCSNVTDDCDLPIQLIEFNGNCTDGLVKLKWTTASEINNDFFTVEKSSDSELWETIGAVQGAGTSNNTNEYSDIDYSPFPGINYYRLSQTDYDGTKEFFNPINVSCSDDNLSGLNISNVYTDDAGNCNILFFCPADGEKCNIILYDNKGQQVFSGSQLSVRGTNTFSFSYDKLAKSVYFITLAGSNSIVSKKIFLN